MIRKFQDISPLHEQYELQQKILHEVMRPLDQLHSCPREQFERIAEFHGKSRMQELWNDFRGCGYHSESDAVEPMAIGLQNDGDELLTGAYLLISW